MKIWNAYASEHSMKLVMIGRFKEVRDAEEAKRLIERLTEQVSAEVESYSQDASPEDDYFSKPMRELLRAANIYSLRPRELEQLAYEFHLEVSGSEVVVRTDEVDVSALLKLLLDKGARVEVYSAHDYPDTEDARDDE